MICTIFNIAIKKVYKTQILIHVGRIFKKSVCDISYTLCIKESSLALLNLQAEFMTYQSKLFTSQTHAYIQLVNYSGTMQKHNTALNLLLWCGIKN